MLLIVEAVLINNLLKSLADVWIGRHIQSLSILIINIKHIFYYLDCNLLIISNSIHRYCEQYRESYCEESLFISAVCHNL